MADNPNKLHTRAQVLFKKNKLPEALSLYKEICAHSPKDAQAWHMAGAIAGMLGEHEYSRQCCEKLVALRPDLHGAHLNLANVLLATGNTHEAFEQYQQALRISPDDPQTLTNLSNLHMHEGRIQHAIGCLEAAIKSDPSHFPAYNNLGVAYRKLGDLEPAEQNLRLALKLKPDFIDAYCNLGAVLSDQLKPDDARDCYEMALRTSPENQFVLHNYGNLYQTIGEYEKAKECYLKALQKNKDDIELLASLASLYERCGDYDNAFDILTPIIEEGKYTADAALVYAKLCNKLGRHEEAVTLLEKFTSMPLDRDHRINICFALGDLHDEMKNYTRAFGYYQDGNKLDDTTTSPGDFSRYFSEIRNYFTIEKLNNTASSVNASELPVFIIGMPRTGTSLVEQILCSHPDVHGGGERSDIINLIGSLDSSSDKSNRYPRLLDSIDAEQLNEMADKYLKNIEASSEGKSRFTDKTPLQGIHMGFINLLLPNSRVIICERDPVDTCLSIYFNRFNAYHNYASNLTRLGVFYRLHERLIQYWTSILDMKILRVQYESLVKNNEPEIRRIIDFCGLDWNQQCLSFHKNKRTVNTPSYNQVRQPIYSSSINRWKHYEQFLEPLLTALSINRDRENPYD